MRKEARQKGNELGQKKRLIEMEMMWIDSADKKVPLLLVGIEPRLDTHEKRTLTIKVEKRETLEK